MNVSKLINYSTDKCWSGQGTTMCAINAKIFLNGWQVLQWWIWSETEPHQHNLTHEFLPQGCEQKLLNIPISKVDYLVSNQLDSPT
jgi:hypothetical protein